MYNFMEPVFDQVRKHKDSTAIHRDYRSKLHILEVEKMLDAHVKDLETTKSLLNGEFPITCDLEMELYLVPKMWVKELIQKHIMDYLYEFGIGIIYLQLVKSSGKEIIKRRIEKIIWILSDANETVRDSFEKQRRKIFIDYGLTAQNNMTMSEIYREGMSLAKY